MDRQIVYPASIPLDTDFLSFNRNVMVALGSLAQAVLGGATIVDGLACTPTAPASLSATVGAGSITQLGPVDTLSYGSLPADTTDQIVKMGINLTPTTFTLTPPATSGESVIYLIEASFAESDTTPVVLPYVNAANPAQPYSGPGNSGVAQNTQRIEPRAAAAESGRRRQYRHANRRPPSIPAGPGFTSSPSITARAPSRRPISPCIPASPFVNFKLPTLTPGFLPPHCLCQQHELHRAARRDLIRATVVGGGGGGGGTDNTYAAAGGGAGGFASGTFAVTPGSDHRCHRRRRGRRRLRRPLRAAPAAPRASAPSAARPAARAANSKRHVSTPGGAAGWAAAGRSRLWRLRLPTARTARWSSAATAAKA